MSYCEVCGNEIPNTAKFCAECGHNVRKNVQAKKSKVVNSNNNFRSLAAIILIVSSFVCVIIGFYMVLINEDFDEWEYLLYGGIFVIGFSLMAIFFGFIGARGSYVYGTIYGNILAIISGLIITFFLHFWTGVGLSSMALVSLIILGLTIENNKP